MWFGDLSTPVYRGILIPVLQLHNIPDSIYITRPCQEHLKYFQSSVTTDNATVNNLVK